jgi:predicted TIM-barrel fold metal-dependent hydrolase
MPPHLRQRTMLGLTNIDPTQPGQVQRLQNLLGYAEVIDPKHELQIGAAGEHNLAKGAVMAQLDEAHLFSFAHDGHYREFLNFVNKEMPGFAMVVHMDAGRPLQFRMKGRQDGIMVHAQTEYTNYEPFVNLINDYPNVNFIHAHWGGLSLAGYPSPQHTTWMRESLQAARHNNLYFDGAWDVASEKILVPGQLPLFTRLMNEHPTRFMWGSDAVAPNSRDAWLGNLDIQQRAGLLGQLRYPDLYLRNNALDVLGRSSDSIMAYRIRNRLRLLNRQLPEPWLTSVNVIRGGR